MSIRLPSRLSTLLPLTPILLAACSSSSSPAESQDSGASAAETGATSGNDGAPEAGPSQDAGLPGVDSGTAPVDAQASPPPFVSSLPGATVSDVGTPPTPNLVLLSLNFLQQPSGGMIYQQWLGDVQNVGSTTLCTTSTDITLEDGTGAPVVVMNESYIDAPAYISTGLTVTEACLAPNAIGSFYSNGFANADAVTSTVTTIAVKFGPHVYAGVMPDPNAPAVTVQPVPYIGAYALQGSLTGQNGSINNISLHGYPRDATGLVLGQIVATDLGTLAPGGSFAFTTDTVPTSFTQFTQFTSFIDGAATGAIRPVSPEAPEVPERVRPALRAAARSEAFAALARQGRSPRPE